MKALLISTYELGRQPFGLASPAASLRVAGVEVICRDTSRQSLSADTVRAADLIAFYVPMHTATRLAADLLPKVRTLNPAAHICIYGLYASVNAEYLRDLGADSIIGGEFEAPLTELARRLGKHIELPGALDGGAVSSNRKPETACNPPWQTGNHIVSVARQQFLVPDRSGLPALSQYARLIVENGSGASERVAGYTEASRGCKHLCRHCPIVPVYNGKFHIVQREVVLADIRRQVEAGAEHITFGDPDFFNGIGHAMAIVRELHREFPQLSYDVTIKIEHLLKHSVALSELHRTGCVLVTSAVESLDDRVLALLDKGHTRADFERAVGLCRSTGLNLSPTFVSFTPWTTRSSYCDLFAALADLELVDSVAPIQLGIRLLVPMGSRLLEVPDRHEWLREFDRAALSYRWEHPDPDMDILCAQAQTAIADGTQAARSRRELFAALWSLAEGAGRRSPPVTAPARATIPYLNEPWFC